MVERIAEKTRAYIGKEIGLSPGTKVIIGFSGGADSVTLLHILHKLGYDCLAAHCNFHLRGEESDRDQAFAQAFAENLGIPFLIKHFDTTATAKEQGISIEMAARDLRYRWFEELREAHHAEVIAVAHHQDDSIETMLLNLIRGTGIAGLTGIRPRNGFVIRPLLCINRKEIEQYITGNGLDYVTDSTNLEDEYMRNKIRLALIPMLETFNPSVRQSLLQTISNLNEASKIYSYHIKENKKQVFDRQQGLIHIPQLLLLPSPEAILFEILSDYGYNKTDIRQILTAADGASGKEFYSKHFRLVKDRQYFILSQRETGTEQTEYLLHKNDLALQYPIRLEIQYLPNTPDMVIKKDPSYAYLDADKLDYPLVLRKWRPGDRFVPFGMKGSQKLSDYFSNNKFSIPRKENTWILCSGDKIAWITGHRTDNRFGIGKHTKHICILKTYPIL